MTKPRLLITRFMPDAQRLAQQLNTQGIFALAQPLLEVHKSLEFASARGVFTKTYDYIIAVSRHAVDYTALALAGDNWPTTRYLAVGKGTQALLSRVTEQQVVIPETHFSSEGLLALSCLAQLQGKRVLILRGVGGRERLAQALTERGAIVEYYQPYQRTAINLCGAHVVALWQQKKINAMIVSSAELLERLLDIVPENELSWLKSVTIYVPSQRLVEYARDCGWLRVKQLPDMSDQHIVDYFK